VVQVNLINKGKTLVGIVTATTIKKRTIVFCNTDLAI
jgi:hypothetical protein